MPRPRPLTNINSSAIPDGSHPFSAHQQLTPRTPHSGSRTSRLEQGFSKIPLAEANDADYDDQNTLQSAPLLASSSTARFSMRSARERERESNSGRNYGKGTFLHPTQFISKFLDRLPLAFGVFMAGVLLILIVLSLTRPEALHRYIGAKAPVPSSTPASSPTASSSVSSPAANDHVAHAQGNMRILSYENYTNFPLTGMEYRHECAVMFSGYMQHGDYWDTNGMGAADVPHAENPSVCSSTIVYMLDGTVGLTADLALAAQAAALARERNRTFLIDDTYWNRGKWQDYFEDVRTLQPGPEPGCKAPPPQELVACPRTARHWVVTARTAKYHFSHEFANHYEDGHGHNLVRSKPIYETSLRSFQTVIRPNEKIQALIGLARDELSKFLQRVSGQGHSTYVGTHIRRGDMKSKSFLYHDRKIPITEYLNAIQATWKRLYTKSSPKAPLPVVYLATDSPTARKEFYDLYDGQTFSLADSKNPILRDYASQREYFQKQFDELDLSTRTSDTTGMIIDLALVDGFWAKPQDNKPDAVVCAVSSTICKLAPFGLGWNRAFGNLNAMGEVDEETKHWIDVDEKGTVVPVWEPFLLFN